MYLVQFKKNQDEISTYHLKFNDGYETQLTSHVLRDNCPCAGCKGEEVLFHKFEPLIRAPISEPGYLLEQAKMVGNYAIQLFWGDGHNTGIYTWDYLRKISSNPSNQKDRA